MTQGKFKGKPKGSWNPKKVKDKERNDVMDLPCHIHTKKDKEKESDKAEDKEDSDGGYPHVNSTLMIFADVESKS